MRRTFLVAVSAVFFFGPVVALVGWTLAVGPETAWPTFVNFSNKWGNVASVLGFILTGVGFGLTFLAFLWTFGEQARIRRAVQTAVATAAASVLSSLADEAEKLLLEFKDAVRRGAWLRAGEKCDDAEARLARMVDHPHLIEDEGERLARGIDDLRLVSRYITRHKTLRETPAAGFHGPKLDAVDRLLATVQGIRGRLQNKAWEV